MYILSSVKELPVVSDTFPVFLPLRLGFSRSVIIGLYVSLPLPNTMTSSVTLIGCIFDSRGLPPFFLSQTQQYLNIFILLAINVVVNGWLAVKTMAAFFLAMRRYCSHIGSNGITLSHLQAVVPYGRSQRIISIDLSGISFISSKQSPCISSIFGIFHLIN